MVRVVKFPCSTDHWDDCYTAFWIGMSSSGKGMIMYPEGDSRISELGLPVNRILCWGKKALKIRKVFYVLYNIGKGIPLSNLSTTALRKQPEPAILLKGVFNPDEYCWIFKEI